MKKITVVLLVTCVMFIFPFSAFAMSSDTIVNDNIVSQDAQAIQSTGDITPLGVYKYMVTANNVNVRSGPGTQYSSHGQMNWGDIVYSQGSPVGKWMPVRCGAPLTGVEGYIHTDYIKQVAD